MKKAILNMLFALLFLTGCTSAQSIETGNTNGNIANFGSRVKVSDGVVFANSRDHLRIYHSSSDGSMVTRISSRSGVYLNVFEDWVYFMSLDDDYSIVRVRIDGSEEEIVSQNMVYPYGGMMIINQWIYYVHANDGNQIYKMSMDGSINERFIEGSAMRLNASDDGLVFILVEEEGSRLMIADYVSGEARTLAHDAFSLTLVVDDWVYFNKSSDQNKLYRVKVDGSDEMKVNDIRVYALNENKGRLYFCDLDQHYRLSSAKLDGSDIKVISEDMSSDLSFSEGWLYYLNHSDSGREYRIKGNEKEKVISVSKATPLSGEESEILIAGSTNSNRINGGYFVKIGDDLIVAGQSENMEGIYRRSLSDVDASFEQISTDQARNLNVWKDWIYYINESDVSGIYRMRADGSEPQIVLDQSVGNLAIFGNWMYFINHNDNQHIYRAKVDGSELTKISESEGLYSFSLEGDWLVYANSTGQTMVKVKLDGSEEQLVTSFSSTFLTSEDGWIYYGDDNTRVALSKVKMDGSGHQNLIRHLASFVHITQDHIVYFDGVEQTIMKMDLNGENITKISKNGDFGWFHVIDDQLYYIDFTRFEWFQMELDGSNVKEIKP